MKSRRMSSTEGTMPSVASSTEEERMGTEDMATELRRTQLVSRMSSTLAALRTEGGVVPPSPVTTVAAISDRTADAFDNASKTASREGNLLAVVEQADELWEDEGHLRLRCAWAELAGATGNLTLEMLLRAGVLAEKGFVGIDLDATTIATHAARYPDFTWIPGDMLDLLHGPELKTVGVLNVDGYDMVGSSGVGAKARLVGDLARRGIETYGAFMLFWNADLDAPRRLGIKPASALREHASLLARALAGVGRARMHLDADDLVRAGQEFPVDDPSFLGLVGRFEVYRGCSTGHRMANLRLLLR